MYPLEPNSWGVIAVFVQNRFMNYMNFVPLWGWQLQILSSTWESLETYIFIVEPDLIVTQMLVLSWKLARNKNDSDLTTAIP